MGKIDRPDAVLSDFVIARRGEDRIASGTLEIGSPVLFEPVFDFTTSDGAIYGGSDSALHIGWLPRGRYSVTAPVPRHVGDDPASLWFQLRHKHGMAYHVAARSEVRPEAGQSITDTGWHVEALSPTPPLSSLAWQKGHSDWFFRHFDHAATTIISYLLGDHPLLKGRILDVGCGDGITDLGVALRTQCAELVGLEPFRQYERLPSIVAENHLPPDVVPPSLRFVAEDANFLPFPDNSFDVVLSWGSVEHMAGGYLQALREVKRVLRPDGLFMVAPGLFYSNIGHHLTEFSSEPFFHLKKSEAEIRDLVLNTPPKYIDRSGEFSSNEQFYQWYTELNRITVARFEQEMRALEFAPWRIALRTDGLVEYSREIEHYPIQDLANTELYSSWFNRKRVRP